MISGISRQNNAQAKPVFSARQVTGKMSDIERVWGKIKTSMNEGKITDAYGLPRIDLIREKRQLGIHTYIFGVNHQADDLRKFGIVQNIAPLPNYKAKLQEWCGRVIDLTKPTQKAEDLLKEMEEPHFDYSKI